MDIQQFQEKLKEIQTLAFHNGKQVNAAFVEKFFESPDMDDEKLKKVYDFLEIQGIYIEGYSKNRAGGLKTEDKEEQQKLVPLSPEEEEFLKDYLESFKNDMDTDKDKEILLAELAQGKETARDRLIACWQEEIVRAARELNCEEVFFGDLLQEGNMGLLMALESAGDKEDACAWVKSEIRSTMKLFIEEQTQQKKEDDILVERVRNLEARVKELTEDEEIKYSVEELAAFLDMDSEEMESVIRLTGDDGQQN